MKIFAAAGCPLAHWGIPSTGAVVWYNGIAMTSQSVSQMRKRFRREWLLIAVDRMDPQTQVPLKGRLLAHSPHRDEVYDRWVKAKGLSVVVYSDTYLPQGYAVAFCA